VKSILNDRLGTYFITEYFSIKDRIKVELWESQKYKTRYHLLEFGTVKWSEISCNSKGRSNSDYEFSPVSGMILHTFYESITNPLSNFTVLHSNIPSLSTKIILEPPPLG